MTVRTEKLDAVSLPAPKRLLPWPSGHAGEMAKQTGGHLASFHHYLDNILLLSARDSCCFSGSVVFSAELILWPSATSTSHSLHLQ